MRLEQLDPKADEQRLRACHFLMISGQAEDDPNGPPPSFASFRGWWAYGFSAEPREVWLASTTDGVPIGCYLLELPQRENKTAAFLELGVSLDNRRRGLGTALLAHSAERAELAGRTVMEGVCRSGAPGDAFAAARNARPGVRDARSVLEVGPELPAILAGLPAAATAQASGYSLAYWAGPAPDELVAQNAAIEAAMGDAPHEDWFEPAIWDAARIRLGEQRVAAQGVRRYSIAAMHDATGEMAALTQLIVDPAVADWAFQEMTAVIRTHRGHHLGILVKAAMLAQLIELEPQVRRVITFNALANEHMIAVNKRLGFQVIDYFQHYQFDVQQQRF
jgi:RimJ/RimL family protein N-acetyltransferase/GNAT superfamily N-acetyltransferase